MESRLCMQKSYAWVRIIKPELLVTIKFNLFNIKYTNINNNLKKLQKNNN